ncbi:type VII secretion integral membrane protein EccD [Actinokineospora sp. UTMC 2448]|uniref:type VII secretion integral membrane protein EccD n=1 Tax=Actinokineospora sp. UTMC 2448 TaxID=2268449 RepID=UPI002164124B|nr:type VII secretion integral membrane protein EccD [Actinokineospora sp. UTMC 2448]UVS79702.1 type VII secretion integral membrane protein EccD [Actinokineospora sp. UTMC 2448]
MARTTSTAATTGSGEMCRLTICGPASRVELAVPAHVPLSDLLPTVLGHLDPALATSGMAHGGWVLQRLGEPPLDEDDGTAAAGLYDGDVLYLRPRDDQLPPVDFDDIVDGVYSGLSTREDAWRPALTRTVCVATAVVCGLLAVLLPVFSGPGMFAALAAGAVAAVLLAVAVMASRVLDDRTAAVALAAVAATGAAVAGLAVAGGGAWFTGPGVLAAGAGAALVAAAARALLGTAGPAFLAVASGGAVVAVGATLGVLTGLDAPTTAAVVVAVALPLTRLAPQLAMWLAGLAVEPVPTSAAEFQEGLDPLPSRAVLDRAAVANAHLTAFLAVFGAVCAGALPVVASASRWEAVAFVSASAVLLLLQARELAGVWHRVTALVPAAVGLVAVLVGWAATLPDAGVVGVLIGLVLLVGCGLAAAVALPGRRLVPRWGRWGDVLHWICALAIVPLVLALADVYGLIAALV